MTDDKRWIDQNGDVIDEDHRGLVYDVQTLINRRRALGIFGGLALTSLLAACGVTQTDAEASPPRRRRRPPPRHRPRPRARRRRHPNPSRRCRTRPAGRTRATGRTASNVLDDSGIVRSDIRSSFGSSTTVAAGRAADDRAHGAGCRDRRGPRRQGRLPLALRPRRELLAVLDRRRERELPARGAADRRERHRDLHLDLPGLLLGPLAAHPLRGVRRRRDRGGRPDRSSRRRRSRCPKRRTPLVYATQRLRAERAQRRRRSRCRATTCSATTAASTRSRPWRGPSPPATPRRSRSASDRPQAMRRSSSSTASAYASAGSGCSNTKVSSPTTISTSCVSARRRSDRKAPRSSSRS